MKKINFALPVVAIAFACIGAKGLAAEPSTAEPPATVSALNSDFRKDYAAQKDVIRKALGPIILVNGGSIVLLNNGKRDEKPIVPVNYSVLKTVDHITLGAFVILLDQVDKPLSENTKNSLKELERAALTAQTDIEASNIPTASKMRQKEIIERSKQFIDEVLGTGSVSQDRLHRFTRSMSKDTLLNADEAIAEQMQLTESAVQGWRSKMTTDEWKRCNFLVLGFHMPRDKNSFMQYFQKITGEDREGKRVIYAENMSEEDKAVDLLVTHRLDEQIAIYYFDDPWRMHRDLLCDAASKYLKKHPPAK